MGPRRTEGAGVNAPAKSFALVALVFGMLASPAVASAQSEAAASGAGSPEDRFAAVAAVVNWTGPATLDRPVSATGMEFTAGTSGSEVTVKGVFGLSEAFGVHDLSITAAAPLDKAKNEGAFALDALTADASLTVGYSVAGFSGRTTASTEAAQAFCARIRAAVCSSAGVAAAAAGPDLEQHLDEWDRLGFGASSYVWIFGGFAKVGHAEFDFLDAATFAERSETETPWSVGAYYSYQPLWNRSLFTVKYEHQQTYDAADESTVCPAPPSGPAIVCLIAPLGAPERDTKDILSFEYRQRFRTHLGFAVTTSYDVSNDAFGIDLPIYLVGGGDYSGGVRFGYTWDDDSDGDKDELKVGVFVSRALTLY